MIAYKHVDIGQWAADTAQYTYDLEQGSSVLRRSSFSSSTASESSLLSDGSHQTSATFSTNTSFTASEQEVISDSGSGNDFTHGKDFLQQWRGALRPDQGGIDQQTQTAWVPGVIETQNARVGGATWSHRTLLRDSQTNTHPTNERQVLAGFAHRCAAKKAHPNATKISCNKACGHLQRRVATDSHLHGCKPASQTAGTNPRRTSTSRTWSKPTLVRQQDRRDDFVLNLVECATQLVAHLWPTAISCPTVTLNFFIQETLRRSRSTYSTLQVTLYYLYLIKSKGRIPSSTTFNAQQQNAIASRGMQCGRRMFLAALILASKYLQDRNFSTNAWTKITNLPAKEINSNEKLFLAAIEYSLHLPLDKYNEWCNRVQGCVNYATLGLPCPWAEVLEEYAASQIDLKNPSRMPCSKPSTITKGSPQLPSSPVLDGAANIAGSIPNINAYDSFTSTKENEISTPSSTLSQTSMPPAPPAPMLDRTLSTPASSSWNSSGSTSGRRAVGCRTEEDLVSFMNMHMLSQTGSQKAPEPHAIAVGKATSQSTDNDVAICMSQMEFSASPMSLTGSKEISFQRRRPQFSRSGTGSSAACYFPSPLRLSMTPQLPTPPMSARSTLSTATELMESIATPREMQNGAIFKTTMDLANRVALEARKHGLETVTLPSMKAQRVYESFSDCSSDVQSNTPLSACVDAVGNTVVPDPSIAESFNLESTSLPAIAHILRCGLREHLKPMMQMQSRASEAEAAKVLGSLKRSLAEADDVGGDGDGAAPPAAKLRRTMLCHGR